MKTDSNNSWFCSLEKRDSVRCKVTARSFHGVYVEIDGGIDAFMFVNSKVGDVYFATVVKIDYERKRILLSPDSLVTDKYVA